jgi:YVTN family beta-propeller protein
MGIATIHYLSMNARDGVVDIPDEEGTNTVLEDWSGSYTFDNLQVPNVYTVNWGDSTATEDVVVGGALSRIKTSNKVVDVPFMFNDPNPYEMAILPDNKTAYVTQPQAGEQSGNPVGRISVVNLQTKKVLDEIAIPNNYYVWGITATSDGSKVYVASGQTTEGDDDKVFVIDTDKREVIKEITVGAYPTGVVINPAGTELWVTCAEDDSIYIIDTATDEVDRFLEFPVAGSEPMRGVFSNDGSIFYVTLWELGQVAAIDSDATTLVDYTNIEVGPTAVAHDYPFGIAKNAAGTRLAVALNGEAGVVIIDTDPFEIIDLVLTEDYPWAIAVDEDDIAYVTHGNGDVYYIDINTETIEDFEYVGANANGITIAPNGVYAYVTVFGWSDCDGQDTYFDLSHTYATPGTYTITATDKDGQVDVKGTVTVLVD